MRNTCWNCKENSSSTVHGPVCRSGVLCAILLVLAACASVREPPAPSLSDAARQQAWETHLAHLGAMSTWGLKGRVAGKSDSEGFQAGVHWEQYPQSFSIDLHGPLGGKTAAISGRAGKVEVQTSGGEHYLAEEPETLLQDLFGYALPVTGLRYWVRGIPSPGRQVLSLELDARGRLKHLSQAGWSIDYNRYHEGSPALPALIEISGTRLDAKIIVDQWF